MDKVRGNSSLSSLENNSSKVIVVTLALVLDLVTRSRFSEIWKIVS